MAFYDEMRGVADELLTEFAQGTVLLRRVTTTEPEHSWEEPTETIETWPLKAAVRTVSMKYVDGTLIVAGDRQVTFAVPPVVPKLAHEKPNNKTTITDLLSIDGKDHAMKDLRPIPGAGTVVAYIAFIAA